MLSRVPSTGNNHKIQWTSYLHVLNDCLVLVTFSLNMEDILSFGRKKISYDQINIRDEFCILKLVVKDILIIFVAQIIRILKMSYFQMAAILDCKLPLPAPGSR